MHLKDAFFVTLDFGLPRSLVGISDNVRRIRSAASALHLSLIVHLASALLQTFFFRSGIWVQACKAGT